MTSRHRMHPALVSILTAILLLSMSISTVGVSATGGSTPPCDPFTRFDRDDFPRWPRDGNTWDPLVPGTQFIMEGRANRGGGSLPHRVVFTVTGLNKVVNGVRTIVLWDRDINEGELVEEELAFHAPDEDGNIWNLGEYPEEYDGKKFAGAPNTWISGVADAKAGVLVPAKARLGSRSFLQGRAPDIDFYDCGKILKKGRKVCVPVKCYDDVLVVDEWSPLEPDSGHQLKYYAPNVGNIQIGAVGDPEGETLVLVDIVRLSPKALEKACKRVLKLDRRAYRISKEIYRYTSPAQGSCARADDDDDDDRRQADVVDLSPDPREGMEDLDLLATSTVDENMLATAAADAHALATAGADSAPVSEVPELLADCATSRCMYLPALFIRAPIPAEAPSPTTTSDVTTTTTVQPEETPTATSTLPPGVTPSATPTLPPGVTPSATPTATSTPTRVLMPGASTSERGDATTLTASAPGPTYSTAASVTESVTTPAASIWLAPKRSGPTR